MIEEDVRQLIKNLCINKGFLLNKKLKQHENLIYDFSSHILNLNFSERTFLFYNNIKEKPKCECCKNNETKYVNFYTGYLRTCSNSCGTKLCAFENPIKDKNHKKRAYVIGSEYGNEFVNFLESLECVFLKRKKGFIETLLKYESDIEIVKSNILKYQSMTGDERKATTEDLYVLRYGEKEGRLRYCNKIKQNIYDVEGIANNKNISIFEAEKIVEDRKKRGGNSISLFHKNNPELVKKKKMFCKEYWINLGYNEQEAELKRIETIKNRTDKGRAVIKNNISKMTDEEYKHYNRSQNPTCFEYWFKRGYDSSIISDLIKNYNKKITGLSKDVWLEKNNGTEEDWIKFNKKRNKKRFDTITKYGDKSIKASKESMKVFSPIICWLKEELHLKEKVYVGYGDSQEYWLADSTKYYYSYDFCIPKFNIIIEFNGERWHPRKNRMDLSDYENWTMLGESNVTAEEKENSDKLKIDKAKEKGFNVLEIWDSTDLETNIELCKNFITKGINNGSENF